MTKNYTTCLSSFRGGTRKQSDKQKNTDWFPSGLPLAVVILPRNCVRLLADDVFFK